MVGRVAGAAVGMEGGTAGVGTVGAAVGAKVHVKLPRVGPGAASTT